MTNNSICECPMLKYGPAKRYEDAGFIMPDGRMVKSTDTIDGIIVHRRAHTELVSSCYRPHEAKSKIEGRLKWMEECRAIRMSISDDGRMHVESRTSPTTKQVEQLLKAVDGQKRLIATANKCPIVGQGEDCYCDYIIDNPGPQDIQKWINKCWK